MYWQRQCSVIWEVYLCELAYFQMVLGPWGISMFWHVDFISSNPSENLPLFFDKGNNNCILVCFYITKYKTGCSSMAIGRPALWGGESSNSWRDFMHSYIGHFLQRETKKKKSREENNDKKLCSVSKDAKKYSSCFDPTNKGIEISDDVTGEKNREVQPGRSRGDFNQIMNSGVFANRSCNSSKTLFMFIPHWKIFASDF